MPYVGKHERQDPGPPLYIPARVVVAHGTLSRVPGEPSVLHPPGDDAPPHKAVNNRVVTLEFVLPNGESATFGMDPDNLDQIAENMRAHVAASREYAR